MADDRYPVDPLNGNAALADYLRELERRITELEAARPLGNTTLQDGTLKIVDSAGALRGQIGRLYKGGGGNDVWGIEVVAQPGDADWTAGKPYFRATEDGVEFPYGYSAWCPSGQLNTYTNTSWETKFEAGLGIISHKYATGSVYAGTDAGTTAEIRILAGSGNTSTVVSIPANTSSIEWTFPPFDHGYTLWTGPAVFSLQVRRTGGTGNVYVYTPPFGLFFVPR